jgi:hypothetical protein
LVDAFVVYDKSEVQLKLQNASLKAVDLIVKDGNDLLFIEITDYGKATVVHPPSKVAIEFISKFVSSVGGFVLAAKANRFEGYTSTDVTLDFQGVLLLYNYQNQGLSMRKKSNVQLELSIKLPQGFRATVIESLQWNFGKLNLVYNS